MPREAQRTSIRGHCTALTASIIQLDSVDTLLSIMLIMVRHEKQKSIINVIISHFLINISISASPGHAQSRVQQRGGGEAAEDDGGKPAYPEVIEAGAADLESRGA